MKKLPRHRVSDISDTGIHLRVFSADGMQHTPVDYAHQDDYYMFGFVESGECDIHIDFNSYRLTAHCAALVLPGQVHSFVQATGLNAYILMIDSAFIEENSKRSFEQYTLGTQTVELSPEQQTEHTSLFTILAGKLAQTGKHPQALALHLSLAIIDIIGEAITSKQTAHSLPQRYVEHTITFRNLLKQHVEHSHSPSYYARMMNISLMYLNEAVKGTTGFSVSQNIQYEIVTRAKRSLIYTSKSVKEIAQELGFEDYAYFTRLFSKTAGISPTDFRKNHK